MDDKVGNMKEESHLLSSPLLIDNLSESIQVPKNVIFCLNLNVGDGRSCSVYFWLGADPR